jgi:hypothetical protein
VETVDAGRFVPALAGRLSLLNDFLIKHQNGLPEWEHPIPAGVKVK